MAQIYGELIRAQLQLATDLTIGANASGLIYFHTGDKKLTVYDGTAWQKLVTESVVIAPSKGGTGVANNDAATLTRVGAHALTLTTTATTSITLPTSGTLALLTDITAGNLTGIVPPSKGGLGQEASGWTGVIKASSGTFSAATIVNADVSATAAIDYSKLSVPDAAIPQAKVANLTTDLAGKVTANLAITASTKTKITYDAKGLVTAGADLVSADIPATLLSKVVSSTPAMTGALTLPVGTTADRSGLSTQGMVRYNTTDATFEGYNGTSWGAIGGGGGGTIDTITQASHGFVVGDVLYLNGATYAKAKADAANTAEVVGVVSSVITSSQFQLTLSGEVSGLTGLVAGEVYFLSPTTAGALTVTEPTVVGQVSLPVGVASSTTSLYVAPKRGAVVGSSNARTQIALANNATTTVQDISAYDAGELTGWISITATTPLRFYVAAQFSKNGAANNFNVSYQVSGDTPPTGFSVTATAAGLLQVTLPSVTGFASASINYALNAPAVGTSFPLSVQSSSIVWSEPVAFRNKIINGNFDIWQRGTSQTAVSGYGSDDRWGNYYTGSSQSVSRQTFTLGQTDVPGNPTYFSRTVVTSSAGANNYVLKQQAIEDVRTFAGKTVTLTFWAKADSSKNMAAEFRQFFGNGGSPSATVEGIGATKFSLTTSWQKFTLTTTIPSIAGKTLGTINDNFFMLTFWFDAGSSFNSRTNSLGQQSGTFDIAQVQIEEGSVATPFEQRPIGTEFSLCQRYYQVLRYAYRFYANAADTYYSPELRPQQMRATPVEAIVGAAIVSTNINSAIQGANSTSSNRQIVLTTTAAGTTTYVADWSASAEL